MSSSVVPTKSEKEIEEIVDNCLNNEENFDIYQTCAIARKIGNDRNVKLMYFFKALVCFVFQITMLVLMVIQFAHSNILSTITDDNTDCCNTEHDTINIKKTSWYKITKSVAFCASLWISVNIYSWMRNLEKQSLYRIKWSNFHNCPTYVSHGWIWFGLYVNFFALFIALIGSNIVIHFAENALDVILNCVAIFWIVDIDNELIGPADYENMKNWLNDESKNVNGSDVENTISSSNHSQNGDEKQNDCNVILSQTYNTNGSCCNRTLYVILSVLETITIICAFVAPFVVITVAFVV